MEIKFLGTGTSVGLPMIAFEHEGVDLKDSRNWRTRSSVHVVMDGFHVQVDAGQEFRIQCLANDITALDAFILTHGHSDHLLGMEDLRRFCSMQDGEAISVYSSSSGLQRVGEVFNYAIRDKAVRRGYPALKLHDMPKRLETAGGYIDRVLLPHGSIEVLGLVFTEKSSGRKFSYFTDCSDVTPEAIALAKGSDVLALDGLRYKPHNTHMTISQATQVAEIIDAPITYLTHIAYPVDHSTCEQTMPPYVRLAYDGLKIDL